MDIADPQEQYNSNLEECLTRDHDDEFSVLKEINDDTTDLNICEKSKEGSTTDIIQESITDPEEKTLVSDWNQECYASLAPMNNGVSVVLERPQTSTTNGITSRGSEHIDRVGISRSFVMIKMKHS